MRVEKGWSIYFHLLTWLGLLPISLSDSGTIESSAVNRKVYYRMLIVFQIITVFFLIYGKVKYWKSPLENYGPTGQYFEFSELIIYLVVQFIIYIWMLCSMEWHLSTIKSILEVDFKTIHLRKQDEKNHTLRNLKILSICVSFHWINSTLLSAEYNSFSADFLIETRSVIMIEYEMNFTQGAVIISFYTALVWKVRTILERVNRRVEEMVEVKKHFSITLSREIVSLLNLRNDILQVCVMDLSVIHGFAILLNSVLFLINLTHLTYYFIWRMERNNSLDRFQLSYTFQSSVLWLAPIVLNFVLAFTCNNIGKEVSFFKIFFKVVFLFNN